MLGERSPRGKRAFISANTHGCVWGEICKGRGVRGLGRRSREPITLHWERQFYHHGHLSPTAPSSRPFSTFSPFSRTSGSCLACPHSAATDTCFLLLEGVWPELLQQELSGKTELYVHFPCNTALTQKNHLIGSSTYWLEFLHVLEYGSAASSMQHSSPKGLSCSQMRLPRSQEKHQGSGVSAQFWSEE